MIDVISVGSNLGLVKRIVGSMLRDGTQLPVACLVGILIGVAINW